MLRAGSRSRRLAVALAGVALLAGCGDDDKGPTPESPAALISDGTPTEVFTAFQKALAAGDAAIACKALAPSAIEQVEAASLGGSCDDWVAEVAGALDPASKANLQATKVDDEKIDGSRATLGYTDPIIDLPLEIELQQIDGTWLISKLATFV